MLKYTTASMGIKVVYPDILYELAKAIVLIRQNADEWNVDPDKIAILGFSAGGALAALYSVHWHRDWLSRQLNVPSSLLRPNAVILAYPAGPDYVTMYEVLKERGGPGLETLRTMISLLLGHEDLDLKKLRELSAISYVDPNTPPTFIWTTADDEIVPVENIISYANALARNRVPFELYIFEHGVHGLSLADRTTARTPEQIDPYVAIWVELALNWLERQFRLKS